MRLVYALVAAALTATAAAGAEPPKFVVTNKIPQSFQIENKLSVKKTTCGCASTGKCACWNDECDCPACGRGAKAKQGGSGGAAADRPFDPAATTPPTSARTAAPTDSKPASSAGTPDPEDTTIPAPSAQPLGGIQTLGGNCANGQCQSSSARPVSRFRLFR